MIRLNLVDNETGNFVPMARELFNHLSSFSHFSETSFENEANRLLKGIAHLHWVKPDYKNTYIEFESEEALAMFILKWG